MRLNPTSPVLFVFSPSSLLEGSKTNRRMFILCCFFFLLMQHRMFNSMHLAFDLISVCRDQEITPQVRPQSINVGFTDIVFSCLRHLHPVICHFPFNFRIRSTYHLVLLSLFLPPVLTHPCAKASAMANFPHGCVAATSLVELLMPVRTLPACRSEGSHALRTQAPQA